MLRLAVSCSTFRGLGSGPYCILEADKTEVMQKEVVKEAFTMTAQEMIQEIKSDLLRYALMADGAFEITGGLILVAGGGPLASLFGVTEPMLLSGLGMVLTLTGLMLIRTAVGRSDVRRMALIAAALNIAWALGSAAALLFGWLPLTTAGKWAVALIAEVVAFYAVIQVYALWRS